MDLYPAGLGVHDPRTAVDGVARLAPRIDSRERRPAEPSPPVAGQLDGQVTPAVPTTTSKRPMVPVTARRLSVTLDAATAADSTFAVLRDTVDVGSVTVPAGATHAAAAIAQEVHFDTSNAWALSCTDNGGGWTVAEITCETIGDQPHAQAVTQTNGTPGGNYRAQYATGGITTSGADLTGYYYYTETIGFDAYLARAASGWDVERACVAYVSFVVYVTDAAGTGVDVELEVNGAATGIRDSHDMADSTDTYSAGGVVYLPAGATVRVALTPDQTLTSALPRLDAIVLAPLETNFTGGE